MHYHGTPITPRDELLKLLGRNFCVRYGEHRDIEVCDEIGQSVMLDNGAFSVHTKGKKADWPGFVAWAEPWLERRTTWAVMPDVIDGDEAAQEKLSAWLFNYNRDVWKRCAPVWHMHEDIRRFQRLCQSHARVCVGSSGEFWQPGSSAWHRRMEQAFNAVCGNGPAPMQIHMLRAMDQARFGPYPFASADSTNLAINFKGSHRQRPRDIRAMAEEIDGRQAPARWHVVREQMALAS